jgi:hypothetical protein
MNSKTPERKKICAIQIVMAEDGSETMGLLTQIEPDRDLHVCGDGFNNKTVTVQMGDFRYFAFREDLEEVQASPMEHIPQRFAYAAVGL